MAYSAAGLHPSTVADSDANAFTKLFDFDSGGGVRLSIWFKLYASAPAAPYSVTGSYSGSTYCTLYVCEFATDGTFTGATPQYDDRIGTATTTPITDTMTTSAEAGLVAVTMNQIGGDNAGAPTANSPYTLLDYNDDGATDGYSCWSYRSGSQAAGNHDTGWTVPSSTAYGSVIIAFEITGGGGSTTPVSAAATAKGTAVLVKAPRLVKASQVRGTPKIVRSVSLNRSATGKGTARAVRSVSKTLTGAKAVGIATIVLLRVILVSAAATGRGVANLVKQANLVKAAQAKGVPLVRRSVSLIRGATAKGAALVRRSISMSRAATAKATANIVKSVAKVLVATGAGLAGVTATFIAGGTTILAAAVGVTTAAMTMLVMKALGSTAVVSGDVVVESTVARIVGRLTGHAGLGIYLKMSRGWSRRRRGWKPRGQGE